MPLHVALLRARGLPPEARSDGGSWWHRGASSSAESCHATMRLLPDGPKRATRSAETHGDGELVRAAWRYLAAAGDAQMYDAIC